MYDPEPLGEMPAACCTLTITLVNSPADIRTPEKPSRAQPNALHPKPDLSAQLQILANLLQVGLLPDLILVRRRGGRGGGEI